MNYQSNCKICKRHGNCVSEKEMEKAYPVHIVIGCSACEPKPQTNADRIRGMSDEELANVLSWMWMLNDKKTAGGWLEWLKKEVSE